MSLVVLRRAAAAVAALGGFWAPSLPGQLDGAVSGRVTEALNGRPVPGAVVSLAGYAHQTSSDADGRYLLRAVRPGRYRVTVRAIGYQPATHDTVLVTGGRTTVLDFVLASEAVLLPSVAVEGRRDELLDPGNTRTIQRVSGDELRDLPVTSVKEALALEAGVVEDSYRGGRAGQEVVVVDGLGFKNQLDASTGQLGLRIPPVALEEASLVTNGFSAAHGQAVSGLVGLVTRDGGDRLEGRVAYEGDRPLPDGWDVGLDRLTVSLGGPLIGPARFFAAVDAQARIDDDPVNAPPPDDTRDPRIAQPSVLPHNSGEQIDLLGKLTVPLGARHRISVLGIGSETQRLLFDPVLKYAERAGSAQRLAGRLGLVHLHSNWRAHAPATVLTDLRVGYFSKEAIRAPLMDDPDFALGGFTFRRLPLAGEAIARAQDSLAALAAIPGFEPPRLSSETPWGVPAFFSTSSPRGELAWNRFQEARGRLDVLFGAGLRTELRFGAEYVRQWVATFARLEAFRAVSPEESLQAAPSPTRARFSPHQAASWMELSYDAPYMTVMVGVRGDLYDPRTATAAAGESETKFTLGPRFALAVPLDEVTLVWSWGRFAQPPDYQYLVDAAFDDTLRTGRFRRGNPSLGFEWSTQYEFNVRARPLPHMALRAGVFVKHLDGLVTSVPIGLDPDSAVLANGDFGNVRGIEVTLDRELIGGVAFRASYVLLDARATATDARDFFRRLQITPIDDTIVPATVEYPLDYDRRHAVTIVGRARVPEIGIPVVAGIECAVVARWSTGLPFSRSNIEGDSILGLPNSARLPNQFKLDALLRRTVVLGGLHMGFYVDVRNLTNRRNIVAVRRDTGEPQADETVIRYLTQRAFFADFRPIPYESPRYRAWADVNGDGQIAGENELVPLYARAARDYTQPLFAYGPPRLVRLGVEVGF